MKQQIIQINFRFDISRQSFETAVATIADKFNAVPGLQWKIWLMNEEAREAGGIYLFESKEAVERFRASELYRRTSTYPGFSAKEFDILEDASFITKAPVGLGTPGYSRVII